MAPSTTTSIPINVSALKYSSIGSWFRVKHAPHRFSHFHRTIQYIKSLFILHTIEQHIPHKSALVVDGEPAGLVTLGRLRKMTDISRRS